MANISTSPQTVSSPVSPRLKTAGLAAGVAAVAISALFLWIFVRLNLIEQLGDTAFIAVVALPLIAYALIVYSDRVSEVSAAGVAVKFEKFANAEVDARATSTDAEADIDSIQIIQKSSFEALRRRRDALSPKDKVAVTMRFGRRGYYSAKGVHDYLNILLGQDAEMPVIFVDDAGCFVASTMGTKLRDALSGAEQTSFIQAIEQGLPGGLAALSEVVALTTTSLKPKTTNSQALEAMLAEDAAVLISVDETNKPIGAVRRDAIMAQMLTTLASG